MIRCHRRRAPHALALAVALATLLGFSPQAAGRSFLWRVTGARGVIYLAGSVHLLTPEYYPLPAAFQEAFAASDLLVEELDMAEMLSSNAQMQMLAKGMLPAGQTLDRIVSRDTYLAVSKRFAALGIPLEPLKQFKPWMLALTLQGLEWQKAGFNADLGLDKYLFDMARTQGKPVRGLETLAFQISRFDEMPADLQDRMLAETVKEIEQTTTSFAKIADAWKSGDASTIEKIVLQDLKAEPDMYQRLLVQRNLMWLPQIEALFDRPKPTFVAVGAAHLVGSDGLLQALRAKGYALEQQ
jgi:uncharacterized protein YbaP (TraB family)